MKKNMWNKIMCLLVCLTINMISYAYDFEADGIYYNVLDDKAKTVSVTHGGGTSCVYWWDTGNGRKAKFTYYDSYSGNICVPKSVAYNNQIFTVVEIEPDAFFCQKGVEDITLPSTITTINNKYCDYGWQDYMQGRGLNAFHGCEFKTINIGNSYILDVLASQTKIPGNNTESSCMARVNKVVLTEDFSGIINVNFDNLGYYQPEYGNGWNFRFSGEICCYSKIPPKFSLSNPFGTALYQETPVYVPEEYFETYCNDNIWKRFSNLTPIALLKDIQLNEEYKEIQKGNFFQLTAIRFPENAFNKEIRWSSSNFHIATVDYEGKISALFKGDAVITATAADGSDVSASCNVHVVDLANSISYKFVDGILAINCDEPNATVYYTVDGTTPTENSTKYDEPIEIKRNCTIKAFATYKDFTPSEVVSYVIDGLKVKTPMISFVDSKFVIETEPSNATIYYTTDGTTPNRQSSKYIEPIFIDYNCTIKAFAVCDNLNDSEIASYNFDADAVRLSAPQIVREGNTLVVTSIPDGASVHYTIDGSVPTLQSSVYTTPIELHHNMVMNAIVMKENYLNSKMVTFVIDEFTCEPVNSMKYNGRYLTLSTTMPESEIHYTIDGTTPTSSSERYNNAIDAEGLNTIRIIVTKKNFNNSKEVTYDTKYYYNGETLSLSEAGTIEKAFEWCGVNNAKSLKVNGNIDNTDLSFILDNPSLRNLDLENTNLSGNTIPDGTFAHTQLVSIFLPKNLTTVGDYLFEGCNNIAAIGCTANIELPSSVISDISNPNLLLYVSQEKYAPSQIRNVVVNGVANDIVLSNGSSNNFYCPREFTARKISYTHNYTQKTVSGKCTGWETIALPFTPTSVTHVKNGQMAPFAASDATKKPFWLCELTEDGFVSSNAIKANTPYIIAMPNNEHYADEYILAGDVTFEGSNVKVLASSGTNYGIMGNKTFVPNFMNVDKTECMTLNVGETYNGYAMGSMFIQGLHNASPFEAYITMEGMESMARRQVFCIDGTATGMETLELGDITIKSYEYGVIVSKTIAGDVVTLYDTVGNVVRSEITNDESVHLKNLPKGIFVLTIKRNGETIKSIKFNL